MVSKFKKYGKLFAIKNLFSLKSHFLEVTTFLCSQPFFEAHQLISELAHGSTTLMPCLSRVRCGRGFWKSNPGSTASKVDFILRYLLPKYPTSLFSEPFKLQFLTTDWVREIKRCRLTFLSPNCSYLIDVTYIGSAGQFAHFTSWSCLIWSIGEETDCNEYIIYVQLRICMVVGHSPLFASVLPLPLFSSPKRKMRPNRLFLSNETFMMAHVGFFSDNW